MEDKIEVGYKGEIESLILCLDCINEKIRGRFDIDDDSDLVIKKIEFLNNKYMVYFWCE